MWLFKSVVEKRKIENLFANQIFKNYFRIYIYFLVQDDIFLTSCRNLHTKSVVRELHVFFFPFTKYGSRNLKIVYEQFV